MFVTLSESIDALNSLAAERERNSPRFTTTEQLREFFLDPSRFATPRPDSLVEALNHLIDLFASLSPADRRSVTSRLNRAAKNQMLIHANSLCSLAGQQGSPDLIGKALAALVIEGGNIDIRDSILALGALHEAAAKLGMDARETFRAAASMADPAGTVQLNTTLLHQINLLAQ